MGKRKRGRPTKLTAGVQTAIVEGVRLGLTFQRAADYGGITYATFANWRKKGEAASSGIYFDFVEAVKKAEVDSEAGLLSRIRGAAAENKHWTAAAWLLERRYPTRYALRGRAQPQTWQEELAQLIRDGLMTPEEAEQVIDDPGLAAEFFRDVGIVRVGDAGNK